MSRVIIETILSRSGRHRAFLHCRDDGLVEVTVERKVPGDGCDEPAYWSRASPRVILADTLERARELANEELALLQ